MRLLHLGAGLAAAEGAALLVVLALAGRAYPLLMLALALKLPLSALAWRGHPGAILTLLLWEGTTVLALLTASDAHVVLRAVGATVAGVTGVLLLGGSGDLGSPTLPRS